MAGESAATGRPHVADALVALGVVADRNEAFNRFLGPQGPAYVHRYAADLETMIGTVADAGGVSVVAHPWASRHDHTALDEAGLARLQGAGLAGIEVDHEDHDAATRAALRAIARDLDLVVTGSSDHHGLGKVGHDLGCNTTAPDQLERLLALAGAAAQASGREHPRGAHRMSDLVSLTLLTEVFVTLFVIMDPIGTIPIFLSLTRGRSQASARRAAWQAVAVSFGVIVAFAFFGQRILDYLGISLPALQAAGGLLLLLVALELLTGKEQAPTAASDVNVALVPLGTPLLAGPGAIVATMVLSREVDHVAEFVAVALGVVLVHVALWLSMRFSLPILRLLREGGVVLVSRIAGLLLSAIAVQLVADAVRAFIAGEG